MGDWHPILAAIEVSPGVWEMIDAQGKKYGDVRFVRRGDELGYRADRDGELVGYYKTLRSARKAVHERFLASHGPQGPPPNPWSFPYPGTGNRDAADVATRPGRLDR